MNDPGSRSTAPIDESPRRTYELDETGFKEVPKRWRKFYRHWGGPEDALAPNEVLCPVCKVVIRSGREFRAGDKVYCVHEAPDADTVYRHAREGGFPADLVTEISSTIGPQTA